MEAILRTNGYNDKYEVVEVLKNPISKANSLALIIDVDGTEKWTGGILIENNPTTRKVLDGLTPLEQWGWLKSVRRDIYVR